MTASVKWSNDDDDDVGDVPLATEFSCDKVLEVIGLKENFVFPK
jgi:hypothetical protein